MTAFYNDTDAFCGQWLRNLIGAGHITPGTVDERSICEIQPTDLMGHERVHLFAGIAGWDYALRLAGWPAGVPVWTGSCPCQPFSCAGKGLGAADKRHLWPEMFRLIRECRPGVVFGEQVASAVGHGWLDGVFDNLNEIGYSTCAVVLTASAVGAPHIRSRIYWAARKETDDEKMLQVQTDAFGRQFLQGQEPIRWPERFVQNMQYRYLPIIPDETQERMSRVQKKVGNESQRKSPGIFKTNPPEKLRQCIDSGSEAQSADKKSSIRSGRAHRGNQASFGFMDMRVDRDSIGQNETEGFQQSISGSNNTECRLSLQQHQDCIVCGELCTRDVGRGKIENNSRGSSRKEIGDGDGTGISAQMEDGNNSNGEENIKNNSVGAPHIRQRLYWVAVAEGFGLQEPGSEPGCSPESSGRSGRVADAELRRPEQRHAGQRAVYESDPDGATLRLADGEREGLEGHAGDGADRDEPGRIGANAAGSVAASDDSFWAASRWHPCRDGKYRRIPLEPALFPLAHGLPGRVGQLRAAGNSIVPQLAAAFIETVMEAMWKN